MAALPGDRDNDLQVASSMTLAEHFVPRRIGTLQRDLPDVQVSLNVTNSEQVAALAADGRIGLGFLEAPRVPASLRSRQVGIDRLVVVVAPAHPWARPPVDLDELARTRLIIREPGSGTREAVDRVLAEAGVEPARPLMVLDANAAIRSVVSAGAGPAVLSAVTVRDDLADGRVVEVPITGVDLHWRLRAVWPKGRQLVGAAGELPRIAMRRNAPT